MPSLTELLCDLGLADCLVGRTGFCVHPRAPLRRVAKVGGTKLPRLDAVRALAPTHLVVNIDENRREDVDALAGFVPHVVVTHPLRPEDNLHLYRLFGEIFDRAGEAAALSVRFEEAFARLRAAVAGRAIERVLYLIWRQPWMTVSRETYVAGMLAAAGWQTLPAQSALRYPAFDFGEPWVREVDRVLLSSEPYRFRACHADEVARLCPRPVALIDGAMTSWYGSRAIAGLHYLADLRRELAAVTG